MLMACMDVECDLYPLDGSIAGTAGLMIRDGAGSNTEKLPLENTALMQVGHRVTKVAGWLCSPDAGLR